MTEQLQSRRTIEAPPAADGATDVTLTYDWSDMPQDIRDSIGQMPPFDESFLATSLDSLAAAATGTAS